MGRLDSVKIPDFFEEGGQDHNPEGTIIITIIISISTTTTLYFVLHLVDFSLEQIHHNHT